MTAGRKPRFGMWRLAAALALILGLGQPVLAQTATTPPAPAETTAPKTATKSQTAGKGGTFTVKPTDDP